MSDIIFRVLFGINSKYLKLGKVSAILQKKYSKTIQDDHHFVKMYPSQDSSIGSISALVVGLPQVQIPARARILQ